jgi:hypothetical protein
MTIEKIIEHREAIAAARACAVSADYRRGLRLGRVEDAG